MVNAEGTRVEEGNGSSSRSPLGLGGIREPRGPGSREEVRGRRGRQRCQEAGERASAGDGVPPDGSNEPTRFGETRPGSTPPGCGKSIAPEKSLVNGPGEGRW